jgi:release factor glutamine methyltransferase
MKVADIKEEFFKDLESILEIHKEIEAQFWILSEELFSISRLKFAMDRSIEVEPSDYDKFLEVLGQLKRGVPLQYTLGKAYFCEMNFKVGTGVLIPRPETEELVEWVVDDHRKMEVKILDIATGSGCIAISVQNSLPNSFVYAFDFSNEALEYANFNNSLVKGRVKFFKDDALNSGESEFLVNEKWDVIISNPPYVLKSEIPQMKANVLDFEPHSALFVEDNEALIFYDKIMDYAFSNLNENAKLYFEINEQFAKEIKQLSTNKGFSSCEMRNDFRGKPRMVKITK